MKVNLDSKFVDFYGNEQKENNKSMKEVIAQGLYVGQGVENTPDAKFEAYKLCNKLMDSSGEIELEENERKLIKDVACQVLTPGGYGQIIDKLEGK